MSSYIILILQDVKWHNPVESGIHCHHAVHYANLTQRHADAATLWEIDECHIMFWIEANIDSALLAQQTIFLYKRALPLVDHQFNLSPTIASSHIHYFKRRQVMQLKIRDTPAPRCILSNINSLRPRQNGSHFADDVLKRIFMNENVWISLKTSLKFAPKVPINNIPALVLAGATPLSGPVMVNILTHICVTRPQWVNTCHNPKGNEWLLSMLPDN